MADLGGCSCARRCRRDDVDRQIRPSVVFMTQFRWGRAFSNSWPGPLAGAYLSLFIRARTRDGNHGIGMS